MEKRIYKADFITQILKVLDENGFNFLGTQNQTGIPRATIRRWSNKYLHIPLRKYVKRKKIKSVNPSNPVTQALRDITPGNPIMLPNPDNNPITITPESDEYQFIGLAEKTRYEILEHIEKRIKEADNINIESLARSMKIVHDMISETRKEALNIPGDNPNTFMNILIQQINLMQDEPANN